MPDGKGRYMYADGDVYEGEFKDGEKVPTTRAATATAAALAFTTPARAGWARGVPSVRRGRV